jgi:hypothetical protein
MMVDQRSSTLAMQGKWPDQPSAAVRPPGSTAVVHTASLACQNAVKAQKFSATSGGIRDPAQRENRPELSRVAHGLVIAGAVVPL